MIPCPICGGASRAMGLLPSRFPLRSCPECSHRFADVGDYDLSSAYGEGYEGFREDPVFGARVRSFFREQLLARTKPGPLLDVGCGGGTAVRVAGELGFEALGFDVSEAAAELCASKGLAAIAGDFPSYDFGERRFRVITFWDVLEHLPRPTRFVDRAFELLEPGGWLVAKVPLHGQGSVRLAGAVPRLARSVLGVPMHIQFFTEPSFDRMLGPRFVEQRRIDIGAMREPTKGGRLRRRLARRIVRTIHETSGDGNLVVLAQRAPTNSAQ
jgi:SAM-dependent methyltransferase